MKTFDEALESTVTLKERPRGPDMPLPMRNALDLAKEITGSDSAQRYIAGMVNLSMEQLIKKAEPPTAEVFLDFAMALAYSALLVGVRIGQAMEKQELEP
jgi:hypothetical protein